MVGVCCLLNIITVSMNLTPSVTFSFKLLASNNHKVTDVCICVNVHITNDCAKSHYIVVRKN